MTAAPSAYLINNLLDAYCNADAFSVATPYMKLHIGDPGSAGTANAAGNTTRKSVSFGVAGVSTAGVIANDVAINWTAGEVTTTEDYTFWSLWDASSGGNFLQSGTVTANSVTAGDVFNIAIGALVITVQVAL